MYKNTSFVATTATSTIIGATGGAASGSGAMTFLGAVSMAGAVKSVPIIGAVVTSAVTAPASVPIVIGAVAGAAVFGSAAAMANHVYYNHDAKDNLEKQNIELHQKNQQLKKKNQMKDQKLDVLNSSFTQEYAKLARTNLSLEKRIISLEQSYGKLDEKQSEMEQNNLKFQIDIQQKTTKVTDHLENQILILKKNDQEKTQQISDLQSGHLTMEEKMKALERKILQLVNQPIHQNTGIEQPSQKFFKSYGI